MGRGVPGVEVLVFPLGESEAPAAVLHTDPKGRFSLAGLPAGSYILALSKPGYRIQLARVNSALLSLLSIRLVSEGGVVTPDPAGGTMDWVLRIPSDDVLKEEDGGPLRVAAAPSAPASTPPQGPGPVGVLDRGHRLPVRGDVNQWYTSTLAALGAGAQTPESTGRSTELQFAGELQGRGSWELQGLARTLSTDGKVAPQTGSETDQGSDRIKLAMNYRLTPADSIEFQARFDRDRYRSQGFPGELASADQEVRTLGYAANYTRKVNDAHRWGVGTDLVRAQARIPQPSADLPVPDAGDLTDWRWSGTADYQASLPRDHRISVAARTRIYRYEMRDEGWAIAPIQAGVIESGERGWSLSFSGEDAWKVAGPVQLLLGLETHASEAWGKSLLLIPRVGARRESASSLVQGWILVHSDGGGPEGGPSGEGSDFSSSTLGYHAEVARRFEGDWVVRGHVHRNALVSGLPAANAVPETLPPAVLADPDSWSQEIGFSVSKDLLGVRGTLESDGGRIVGRVGGMLGEAPVQSLQEGSARYLALRASASVMKTDTRLHLDYTKLDGSEVPGSETSSQVNLVVFQPIPIVSDRGAGSWRVLFGYQGTTREAHSQDAPLSAPEGPEKIHRFSGGVGVTF